jgi:transposase
VRIEGARGIEAEADAGVDGTVKIEIEFADARVRVPMGADAATLRNVIAALRTAR